MLDTDYPSPSRFMAEMAHLANYQLFPHRWLVDVKQKNFDSTVVRLGTAALLLGLGSYVLDGKFTKPAAIGIGVAYAFASAVSARRMVSASTLLSQANGYLLAHALTLETAQKASVFTIDEELNAAVKKVVEANVGVYNAALGAAASGAEGPARKRILSKKLVESKGM